MSWLQGFVSNWLASEQVIKLHEISEQNRERFGYSERQFDWDDPTFTAEADKITDSFYESYPKIVREKGVLAKHFPEKRVAVDMINKLANQGKLSALEYLVLLKEILTPKKINEGNAA